MREKERMNQTIRFLKWIKKYPGWWQLICEPGAEHMSFDMARLLIKRLAEASFYEMIFVLLEIHKDEGYIKTAKEALLNDLLISEWKNGNKDDIIGKLIAYLE